MMKRCAGMLVVFTVASSATVAHASVPSLTWESTVQYDHGGPASAAANGYSVGWDVEMHLGGNPNGGYTNYPFWYDTSGWGWSNWDGGYEMTTADTGYWLNLSGDGSSTSDIFTMAWGNGGWTYYQTATFNTSSYTLSPNYPPQLCSNGGGEFPGFYPSVAQSTTLNGYPYFFAVQNANNNGSVSPEILFEWGYQNGNNIYWQGCYGVEVATGYLPSIAAWPINNNTFFIALAYQDSNDNILTDESLTMLTGQWTIGNSAPTWYGEYQYGLGYAPSVAICGRDRNPAVLMDVHGVNGATWYDWGPIEGGWETWPGITQQGWIDGGGTAIQPHVACNSWYGFETHTNSNDSNPNIFMTKFSFN